MADSEQNQITQQDLSLLEKPQILHQPRNQEELDYWLELGNVYQSRSPCAKPDCA